MSKFNKYLCIAILLFIAKSPLPLMADEEMTLVCTIDFPDLDSASVTSITPVGDFNADGYDDLVIGVRQGPYNDRLEAAYMYYGGPDFDLVPDLIFKGDTNDYEICIQYEATGYGKHVCDLGDFNNDGCDDMAIATPGMCAGEMYNGRIYFYYGSPSPDTTADLIIDGEYYRDDLGYYMIGGNFAGDNSGDLLTIAYNQYYGQRVMIFCGSSQPDADYDFLYDYTYQEVDVWRFFGGYDLNSDGWDEFGISVSAEGPDTTMLFLGGEEIAPQPEYRYFDGSIYLIDDISGDSFDDFIVRDYENYELYLCLGGNPIDTIPDYYMWTERFFQCYPYVYPIAGGTRKLIIDNLRTDQLFLYTVGVPFDAIPWSVFNYDQPGRASAPIYVGDINADGITEFGMMMRPDSIHMEVNLYSLITTGIDDNNDRAIPNHTKMLSCYPNPFNSSTLITYTGTQEGDIEIYDLMGRKVKSFNDRGGGGDRVAWDGTDMNNNKLSSGVYFVKLSNSEKSYSQKVVFIK